MKGIGMFPRATRLGEPVGRRIGKLGQKLYAKQFFQCESRKNLVQDFETQHGKAMDPPLLFQRGGDIGTGAFRFSHRGRRSKLRYYAEYFKKRIGKFLIIRVIQRFGGIITGGLPCRFTYGFLCKSKDTLPERSVFLVIRTDFLQPPRHDAAERTAYRTAQIQFEGHRYVDQGCIF